MPRFFRPTLTVLLVAALATCAFAECNDDEMLQYSVAQGPFQPVHVPYQFLVRSVRKSGPVPQVQAVYAMPVVQTAVQNPAMRPLQQPVQIQSTVQTQQARPV